MFETRGKNIGGISCYVWWNPITKQNSCSLSPYWGGASSFFSLSICAESNLSRHCNWESVEGNMFTRIIYYVESSNSELIKLCWCSELLLYHLLVQPRNTNNYKAGVFSVKWPLTFELNAHTNHYYSSISNVLTPVRVRSCLLTLCWAFPFLSSFVVPGLLF